jgi:2-keto-4-pentenoate hydratase
LKLAMQPGDCVLTGAVAELHPRQAARKLGIRFEGLEAGACLQDSL